MCVIILFCSFAYAQNLEKGKISGEVFIDYFYNISRDSAISKIPNSVVKGAKDFNGFQFRRLTFTYDYDFSSRFLSRIRFEANQALTVGNTVNLFVKDLSLKWQNIFDGSDLILGLQPTPAFEMSECYWQFRSLEKTITDLRDIAATRDMGIALRGRFDSEGLIGYVVMFANNSSLGGETDKYKRAYVHLSIAPIKDMIITLYSDYKFRSKLYHSNSSSQSIVSLNNDVITSAAFIGIKDVDFSAGVEGFLQMTRNGYSTSSTNLINYSNLNGFGVSVFGNYEFLKDIYFVGRYDYYDPNSKVNFDSRNLVVLGLSFLADKNVQIIPNVLLETYQKNKTITYDPSITGRLTVSFAY